MRSYRPGEIRSAVLLTALVTALAVVALLDPSCRPRAGAPGAGQPWSRARP